MSSVSSECVFCHHALSQMRESIQVRPNDQQSKECVHYNFNTNYSSVEENDVLHGQAQMYPVLGNASVLLEDCWLVPGWQQLHVKSPCREDVPKHGINIAKTHENSTHVHMYGTACIRALFITTKLFVQKFCQKKCTYIVIH